MIRKHYLLKDVARKLGIKPYRITYALSTRLVGEPSLRIGNKRVFSPEDVDRLAAHFGAGGKKALQGNGE
jgi:DNA-binding transcriptional MerR regulator